MSNVWKLLARMRADSNPCNYSYHDAARVLDGFGFVRANRNGGGSHRLWRLDPQVRNLPRVVIVGLVESGHGPIKAVYIKEMLKTLEEAGLFDGLENDDA